MDFGALPPEINSTRMYAGAGAAPLMAAGATWNGLAVELSTTASSVESVIMQLTTEQWLGPASMSMVVAAQPYLAWLTYTAESAAHAAAQAMASAAAFEAAFAMTVPPAEVAANRALLAALVATNVLGQNTPAIMATEAHYGEMWAQDCRGGDTIRQAAGHHHRHSPAHAVAADTEAVPDHLRAAGQVVEKRIGITGYPVGR